MSDGGKGDDRRPEGQKGAYTSNYPGIDWNARAREARKRAGGQDIADAMDRAAWRVAGTYEDTFGVTPANPEDAP